MIGARIALFRSRISFDRDRRVPPAPRSVIRAPVPWRTIFPLFAALLLVTYGTGHADGFAVRDALRPFTLDDQHDVAGGIDETTRVLVVTHDMGGGGVLKEAFAHVDQAWLDARHVVYVANVSGMPKRVTRLFAIPGMRKRAYRILLDRDGDATRDVPVAKDRVTVLRLDRLHVTGVVQAATPEELRAALE